MEEKNIEDIITNIKSNSTLIIEKISQEDIDIYNFIQDQFRISKGNIKNNSLFKFTFRKYYFRGNERFFEPVFFKFYFNKFSSEALHKRLRSERDINNIIIEILKILKPFRNNIEFSYTTKMIHTINNNFPIYDSYVINALKLKPPNQLDEIERRKQYISNFHKIEEIYKYIIDNNSLKDVIKEFSSQRDILLLNNVKILDFFFWSAGK